MNYRDFEKKIVDKISANKIDVDTTSLIKNLEDRGVFSESSNNRHKWIWILLLSSLILSIYPIYILMKSSPDDMEVDNSQLVKTFPQSEVKIHDFDWQMNFEDEYKYANFDSLSQGIEPQTDELSFSIGNIKREKLRVSNQKETQLKLKNNTLNIDPQELDVSPKPEVITNSIERVLDSEIRSSAEGPKKKQTIIDQTLIDNPNIVICKTLDHNFLFSQLTSLDTPDLSNYFLKKNGGECPGFGNYNRWRLDIIPEFGLFRPIKTFQDLSSGLNDAIDSRMENERSLEGIQLGLYSRLTHHSSNVYLQIGASYTRLSERMIWDYSYIRTDTTTGIISMTVSQTGDTITTIYGDVFSQTEVTGTDRVHYYHNVLDIPLIGGYNLGVEDWSFGVEAGIMFNLNLISEGRILNDQLSFDDIKENNPFRPNIGMTYLAGLNASRQVGKGMVQLSIRYRVTPKSYSLEGVKFNQYYDQIGLNLGYIIPLANW